MGMEPCLFAWEIITTALSRRSQDMSTWGAECVAIAGVSRRRLWRGYADRQLWKRSQIKIKEQPHMNRQFEAGALDYNTHIPKTEVLWGAGNKIELKARNLLHFKTIGLTG